MKDAKDILLGLCAMAAFGIAFILFTGAAVWLCGWWFHLLGLI